MTSVVTNISPSEENTEEKKESSGSNEEGLSFKLPPFGKGPSSTTRFFPEGGRFDIVEETRKMGWRQGSLRAGPYLPSPEHLALIKGIRRLPDHEGKERYVLEVEYPEGLSNEDKRLLLCDCGLYSPAFIDSACLRCGTNWK